MTHRKGIPQRSGGAGISLQNARGTWGRSDIYKRLGGFEILEVRNLLAVQSFPVPFTSVSPGGALIYRSSASASIDTSAEVEHFTVNLDDGQTISILVDPTTTLDADVTIRSPSGAVIGAASANGRGLDEVINTVATNGPGTYSVDVAANGGGSIGSFSVAITLNAALELEGAGGPTNDTPAVAQDLNSAFLRLGAAGADRSAVLGTLRSSTGVLVDGDDFEAGTLDGQWTIRSSDAGGRIQVTSAFGASSGLFALLMDRNPSGSSNLNEAIWTVNLAGITDATLHFSHVEFNDEETLLPPSFTGSATGDGVSISADGVHWHTVLNATDLSANTWTPVSLDLDAAAAAAGITLGNDFKVKFQQYDDFPLTTDGRGYDGIRVTTPGSSDDWYRFDLDDGESVSIALALGSPGNALLDLYSDSGISQIASGVRNGDLSQVISNFVDPLGGGALATYYVRVRGTDSQYNLVVTRNSDSEVELSGNRSNDVQDITLSGVVLGRVSSGTPGANVSLGLIQDNEPWSRMSNNAVAAALGYSVTQIPSAGLSSTDLSVFDVIVIASDQFTTTYSNIVAQFSAVESFVSNGGVLIVNYANGHSGDPFPHDLFPGANGLAINNSYGADINVLDPTSGLLVGPGGTITNSNLDGGNNSYHGYVNSSLPPGARAILTTGTASQIVAFDYPFGSGLVVAHTIPVEFYNRGPHPIGSVFHPNLFAYAASQSTSDGDQYNVSVRAGDDVTIEILVPASGSGQFVNRLDPAIELHDPAGNLVVSSTNATLVYHATLTGTYNVHVLGEHRTRGEYVLHVSGHTGFLPPFRVTASSPADDAFLQTQPARITLDFSDPILLSSVAAADLTIDGVTSSHVTVVDNDTLSFDLPILGLGTHTLSISAGAIRDLQGQSLEAFSAQFTIDTTAPRIVASSVLEGDVVERGTTTYVLTFNEALDTAVLDPSDVQLLGQLTGARIPTSLSFDSSTSTLTLQFAGLPEDEYTLRLRSGPGSLRDLAGNPLDGEFNAATTVPSGDGVPGGDFTVHFIVDTTAGSLPVPFVPAGPLGSLIYASNITGRIAPATDRDQFAVDLDEGQQLTLILSAEFQGVVTLLGPDGLPLATARAPAVGGDVVIQGAPVAVAGRYTVRIESARVTAGDYNNDGVVDAADFTVWRDNLGSTGPLPNRAAGSNGLIGQAEFDSWRTRFGNRQEASTVVSDYNSDGIVDAADFTVWRDNLGSTGPLPNRAAGSNGQIGQAELDSWTTRFGDRQEASTVVGDYNSDGIVDAADFTVWRDNLGSASALPNQPPAVTSVVGQSDFDFWYAHFGTSLAPTTFGNFVLKAVLNGVAEAESHGGHSNDSPADAQSLDSNFSLLSDGATQYLAVLGAVTGPPAGVLFRETFPSTSFDPTRWSTVSNAEIDGVGIAEPSEPYSARLNGLPIGGDLIESQTIDLSQQSTVVISYRFERTGGGERVDPGEDLILSYRNVSGSWVELDRQFGNDAPMTNYQLSEVSLPAAALHANFRFRFTNIGTAGPFDDWFVDDISITGTNANPDAGDWYRFSLADGESATVAVNATSGQVSLDLYDTTGTMKLASGLSMSNWSRGIENFVDTTADGTANAYLLQVRGRNADYQLSIVRNAGLDFEPNETFHEARDVGGINHVLGHVNQGGEDWYQVAVNSGDRLALGLSAPGGGPFEFINSLSLGQRRGLIISEVVDGVVGDGNPKFVEITNTSLTDYVFGSGGLIVQTNNSVDRTVDVNLSGVRIAAGESFVIAANSNDGDSVFESVYGFAADLYADAFLGDGNDRFLLTDTNDGSHILDIFGEIDRNGLGRPWEYTDSYAYRKALKAYPSGATFDTSDWFIAGPNALETVDDATNTQLLRRVTSPGAHTYLPSGSPALEIELYDPSGNVVASEVGGLNYLAGRTGSYRVRIVSLGSAGEYVMAVNGATGLNNPPYVVATNPVDSGLYNQFPTTFVVTVSEPLLDGTMTSSDLLVNGQSVATRVTQSDPFTYRFDLNPTANVGDGIYMVELRSGAFRDLSGRSNTPFAMSFTYDATAPIVSDVLFNGASLPLGGNLLAGTLTVEAFFSEDLREESAPGQIGPEDVRLTNKLSGTVIAATAVAYDPLLNKVVLTFPSLGESTYSLELLSGNGAFEDRAGNDLDGEPAGPRPIGTPSGDGIVGGNFVVRFQTDTVGSRIVEPFDRLLPLGSFMAVSPRNFGLIGAPGDVDDFEVYVQDGQILSAVLTPDDRSATMFFTVLGVAGPIFSTAPGRPVTLAPQLIPVSGPVTLRVFGDRTTTYKLDIYANASHESLVGDSANGNELAIDATRLVLGSGATRWGAIGETTANPSLSTTYTQDFNLGTGGFVFNNSSFGSGNGLWHGSTGRQSDSDPNHSPAGSIYFGRNEGPLGGGSYNTGAATAGTATSPTIVLPTARVLQLSLNHFLATDGALGRDIASIEINAGGGFTRLVSTADGTLVHNTNGHWAPLTIDVSQYAGRSVSLRFTFDTVNDFQNAFEGWYVDDIRIQAANSYIADIDEYTIDLSNYVGHPIDFVVAGQTRGSLSSASVQLLGPDGSTVLATASANPLGGPAVNFDQAILGYVAAFPGRYTLRVISDQPGQYGVLVNALVRFEGEPNDDVASGLRVIDSTHSGLGFLAALPHAANTVPPANGSQELPLSEKFVPLAIPAALKTAFLPVGMSIEDLALALDAAKHEPLDGAANPASQPQQFGPNGLTIFTESEPNDATSTANIVPLGFAVGNDTAIDVSASLGLPRATIVPREDDGAIPLATRTGLTTGNLAFASASVGDGPFGNTTGDYDWYEIPGVSVGQVITVDIDARVIGSGLDSVVGIYNSSGRLLSSNDDANGLDSFLSYSVTAAGNYYVVVTAYGSAFQRDPFDSSSGIGARSGGIYNVTIGLSAAGGVQDVDVFRVSLGAGDILGASVTGAARSLTLLDATGQVMVGSSQNLASIFPPTSPLPRNGNALLSAVIPVSGDYFIRVSNGSGNYTLSLRDFRPVLESEPVGVHQTLYLDFDGAAIDRSVFGGRGTATLSPLTRYLAGWGLTAADENTVIDAIIATVRENVSNDIRARGNNGDFAATAIPGQFDVEILNSRDHVDPFGQPNVSRVIVGGSISELGISTIGIAETIDVGNFDTSESAVVLLDLLSAGAGNLNSLNRFIRAAGVSIIDLIGVGVGNIVSHEAGHFFANWHTTNANSALNIMDQGGNLAGTIGLVGSIWGDGNEIDVDFVRDQFASDEGFSGTEDTLNSIAFGLATGKMNTALTGPRVVAIDPRAGVVHDLDITSIAITFSEPISAASAIAPANYQLFEAGPNGVLENGGGDDVVLSLTPVFDGDKHVDLMIGNGISPLGFGKFRFVVRSNNSIVDLDGNPLNSITGPGGGSDFVHSFDVVFSVPGGGDFYRMDLLAGQRVSLTTLTRWDDPMGDLTNDLDTRMIVYNNIGVPIVIDNNSEDGKNPLAVFVAGITGPYFIQVIAESGAGEYILDAQIEAAAPLSAAAMSVAPVAESPLVTSLPDPPQVASAAISAIASPETTYDSIAMEPTETVGFIGGRVGRELTGEPYFSTDVTPQVVVQLVDTSGTATTSGGRISERKIDAREVTGEFALKPIHIGASNIIYNINFGAITNGGLPSSRQQGRQRGHSRIEFEQEVEASDVFFAELGKAMDADRWLDVRN